MPSCLPPRRIDRYISSVLIALQHKLFRSTTVIADQREDCHPCLRWNIFNEVKMLSHNLVTYEPVKWRFLVNTRETVSSYIKALCTSCNVKPISETKKKSMDHFLAVRVSRVYFMKLCCGVTCNCELSPPLTTHLITQLQEILIFCLCSYYTVVYGAVTCIASGGLILHA